MREIAASDAKNRFGQLLDSAQSAPVRVTKKGGRRDDVDAAVRAPAGAAWERLSATMDALGAQATDNGLTDAALDALLADES